jgi:hypothetical protein
MTRLRRWRRSLTSWEVIDLIENHVRQLHRDLLKCSAKDERHSNEYKTLPNDVAVFDVDGKSLGVVFETNLVLSVPDAFGRHFSSSQARFRTTQSACVSGYSQAYSQL